MIKLTTDKPLTGLDVISLLDYPVPVLENGEPDPDALKEVRKKMKTDRQWAIEFDLRHGA